MHATAEVDSLRSLLLGSNWYQSYNAGQSERLATEEVYSSNNNKERSDSRKKKTKKRASGDLRRTELRNISNKDKMIEQNKTRNDELFVVGCYELESVEAGGGRGRKNFAAPGGSGFAVDCGASLVMLSRGFGRAGGAITVAPDSASENSDGRGTFAEAGGDPNTTASGGVSKLPPAEPDAAAAAADAAAALDARRAVARLVIAAASACDGGGPLIPSPAIDGGG